MLKVKGTGVNSSETLGSIEPQEETVMTNHPRVPLTRRFSFLFFKNMKEAMGFECYPMWIGASLMALVVKNPPAKSGDVGSIPGLVRSPGEGNGNSLQYSCLESSMDKGAWQATVSGVERVTHD